MPGVSKADTDKGGESHGCAARGRQVAGLALNDAPAKPSTPATGVKYACVGLSCAAVLATTVSALTGTRCHLSAAFVGGRGGRAYGDVDRYVPPHQRNKILSSTTGNAAPVTQAAPAATAAAAPAAAPSPSDSPSASLDRVSRDFRLEGGGGVPPRDFNWGRTGSREGRETRDTWGRGSQDVRASTSRKWEVWHRAVRRRVQPGLRHWC